MCIQILDLLIALFSKSHKFCRFCKSHCILGRISIYLLKIHSYTVEL